MKFTRYTLGLYLFLSFPAYSVKRQFVLTLPTLWAKKFAQENCRYTVYVQHQFYVKIRNYSSLYVHYIVFISYWYSTQIITIKSNNVKTLIYMHRILTLASQALYRRTLYTKLLLDKTNELLYNYEWNLHRNRVNEPKYYFNIRYSTA